MQSYTYLYTLYLKYVNFEIYQNVINRYFTEIFNLLKEYISLISCLQVDQKINN